MRCSRCGNDNPGDNRFCGMCGATLLAPAPPVTAVPETATQRAASAGPNIPSPVVTAPTRPADPPRPAAPVPMPPPPPAPRSEPAISGPSFLGLGDAPPRKRASLSIDPHHHGNSGSVDYLLEDDDEPKHGGSGKGIFILVVLAIVVGFGYLRWKNNGFTWGSTPAKPAATDQTPPADTSASSTPSNPAPSSSITPDTTPAANPAASQPAQPAAPAKTDSTPPASAAPPPDTTAKNDTKPAAPDKTTSEADNSDDEEPATPPAKAEAPKPKPAPAKPTAAAPKPVRAGDSVTEAQRYLYGKGVPQNCDRGLQLLKPEANKANPKAMIEMGALYSAGLCTPRDLPTAYRWFAQALRKDPDNQAVQTDLQKLWGEMTQPERQLAIKLSQ